MSPALEVYIMLGWLTSNLVKTATIQIIHELTEFTYSTGFLLKVPRTTHVPDMPQNPYIFLITEITYIFLLHDAILFPHCNIH